MGGRGGAPNPGLMLEEKKEVKRKLGIAVDKVRGSACPWSELAQPYPIVVLSCSFCLLPVILQGCWGKDHSTDLCSCSSSDSGRSCESDTHVLVSMCQQEDLGSAIPSVREGWSFYTCVLLPQEQESCKEKLMLRCPWHSPVIRSAYRRSE